MSSVLEKITLYDLLGYLMPGSLVTLLAGGGMLISADEAVKKWYQDYTGLVLYAFIALSFVCGILLSEAGHILLEIMNIKGKDYKSPLPFSIVQKAMEKAGLQYPAFDESQMGKYLAYMFSDIQNDKNYSRIHNYASAKQMYRNIMIAAIIDMLIGGGYYVWKQDCCSALWIFLAGTVIICLFGRRYQRFEKKTRDYTVYWYVEKYLGRASDMSVG